MFRPHLLSILALFAVTFVACEQLELDMEDDQLILAIEESEMVSVDLTDLPAEAQQTIKDDYAESEVEEAQMAPEFGYAITMMGHSGPSRGVRARIFFNLRGRLLRGTGKGHAKRDSTKGGKCFRFVYPVSYTMPDGSILTGSDRSTLDSLIKAWYVANPNASGKPSLNYPVDIIFPDSTIVSISSDTALARAKKACAKRKPGKGKGHGKAKRDKCFRFVYPITYIMPDGSTITGSDRMTVDSLLKDWYQLNPGTTTRPTLQYPVSIILPDSSIVSVSSDSALNSQATACDSLKRPGGKSRPGGKGKANCFTYVYPLTYLMPDSTTLTGNDKATLAAAIRAWYAANPTANGKPKLQYPYSVTLRGGRVIVISNDADLRRLKALCR